MADTFVRDTHSSALINPDTRGAAAYKARREKSVRLEELEQSINSLTRDMAEIRQLILQLVRD